MVYLPGQQAAFQELPHQRLNVASTNNAIIVKPQDLEKIVSVLLNNSYIREIPATGSFKIYLVKTILIGGHDATIVISHDIKTGT